MSKEVEFVKGLFFKPKHEKAPDFVLGNLSAKRVELIEFLNSKSDDRINMQILMSKNDKPYICVDDWKPEKPNSGPESIEGSEEPPF